MNRLKNQRAYLAGPMDRCPNGGKDWREYISNILEYNGAIPLNPSKKPIDIAIENDDSRERRKILKQNQQYDELTKEMKIIRNVDLRMVDISDFIIANLDLDIFPCGTYEEIFLANRQKKPIIIHMKQGKENAPDWLFGTIPHDMIFSSWSEVANYIDYINYLTNIKHNKRWFFFNL